VTIRTDIIPAGGPVGVKNLQTVLPGLPGMSIWEAGLLGVVQGLTEFLPISSTAHLLVARALLGHPRPEDAFTTVIQLGTLVAVFAYFRGDVVRLGRGLLADVRAVRPGSNPDGQTAWLIILGTVPVVLVGLFLKKWLKATFYNLPAIAWVAIVFALLLAAAEWWAARRARLGLPARGEQDVTWFDALWVGLWQALALMPGGSRSGTTITGGLFAGLDRTAAARFSFLLSLPAILAAGVKEFWDERHELLSSSGDAAALAVGLVVSAVVGYWSIAWLLYFLKRYSTAVFIVYRLLLGAAVLGLLAAGAL
jgi:undecaprenyl-diphosphatase